MALFSCLLLCYLFLAQLVLKVAHFYGGTSSSKHPPSPLLPHNKMKTLLTFIKVRLVAVRSSTCTHPTLFKNTRDSASTHTPHISTVLDNLTKPNINTQNYIGVCNNTYSRCVPLSLCSLQLMISTNVSVAIGLPT